MRIAVDAMGGDLGPEEVVRGVVQALRQNEDGSTIYLLVGDEQALNRELARHKGEPLLKNICIHPATQTIEMTDKPHEVYRKKPDASVVVSARLVKEGAADAFVSIGNTGAAMAASMFLLRRIPGVDRPAIATPLPSLAGQVILLDAGANVDCVPQQLLEFALMGQCHARRVLGIPNPSVGLLSNGEEESKGNELTRETHKLLKEKLPGFKGNVEGKDIFRGKANVIVCDGFDGNIVLKTGEGVAELVMNLLKEELTHNKWMKPFLWPFRNGLKRLRRRLDYREFGGAPLLGVNGVCIIGHGRSDARAIIGALRVAETSVRENVVQEIERAMLALKPPSVAAKP